MSIIADVPNYLAIVILWTILFPIVYYILYDKIYRMGIYHSISKSGKPIHSVLLCSLCEADENGICDFEKGKVETPLEKFLEVLKCNVYLSLPLIFTFYSSIHATSMSSFNSERAFLMSFEISLIVLFWLRIQANPIKQFVGFIYHICHMSESADVYPVIVRYKERTLEFYHSFITASIIVLFLEISYYIMINESVSYHLEAQISALLVIIYIIGILCVTLFSEKILEKYIWGDPKYGSLSSPVRP